MLKICDTHESKLKDFVYWLIMENVYWSVESNTVDSNALTLDEYHTGQTKALLIRDVALRTERPCAMQGGLLGRTIGFVY
jgi:hypothetical protein